MAPTESVVEKDGRCKILAAEDARNSLLSYLSSLKVIYGGNECRSADLLLDPKQNPDSNGLVAQLDIFTVTLGADRIPSPSRSVRAFL